MPRLEQWFKCSLPPTPCQLHLNYFEIPSGRNHHHKYLRFQFIKRQRKKTHTYTLPVIWEMSRRAFLKHPPNTCWPHLIPPRVVFYLVCVSISEKGKEHSETLLRTHVRWTMPMLTASSVAQGGRPKESFKVESNLWGASPCVSDPCTLCRARTGHLPASCYQGSGSPRPGLHLVKVTYLRRLKLRSSLLAKCPQSLPRCSGISLQSWPM